MPRRKKQQQQQQQRSSSVHNIPEAKTVIMRNEKTRAVELKRSLSQPEDVLRVHHEELKNSAEKHETMSDKVMSVADDTPKPIEEKTVQTEKQQTPRLIVVESKEEDTIIEQPTFASRAKSDGYLYDSDSSTSDSISRLERGSPDWSQSCDNLTAIGGTTHKAGKSGFEWRANVVYFYFHSQKAALPELQQFIMQLVSIRGHYHFLCWL